MYLPEITIKRTGQVWSLFVDGSMHTYGFVDRATALQARQRLLVELEYEFSAARLTTQLIIKGILQ